MSFDIFLLFLILSGYQDWLLRRLRLLRLTPFLYCSPQGHLKSTRTKRLLAQPILFSTPLLASKLAARHKKQKDVFRHLFALSVLSGYQDSNLGPPAPKAGALTGLRYTPNSGANIRNYLQFATICTDIISLLPPLLAICRYQI